MLKKNLAVFSILALLLGSVTPAFADHGRDYNRHQGNYGRVHSSRDRHHVVRRLPHGHRTVFFSGRPYYYADGFFYRNIRHGVYIVTAPPPTVITVPIQTVQTVETEVRTPIDSYDIYIPNSNGSFTLVTIHKTHKGFVGPQGEIYPEHPTVGQLKAMYGK